MVHYKIAQVALSFFLQLHLQNNPIVQDNHDHGKTDDSNADIYTLLQTQQGCECVLTFIQFIKPK